MSAQGYGGGNMAAGDPGRRMLDTNKNISNVATYESLRKELREVLTQIISYMKPHCGPKSQYAMIVTGLGNADFEPNIFTKDGIKTLSFIEYASCIQSYMKNFLTYIGKRVDNVAKDGTTTSMLFAALFVLKCLDDTELNAVNLTTVQKEKIFKQLMKDVFEQLQNYTYTFSDMQDVYASFAENIKKFEDMDFQYTNSDVGGTVAYMQTLSSSGGNQELAEVLRDVFVASPPEVWDHLQMMQSTLEKDKSFEVYYQPSDYKLMSILATNQVLNTDLNTRYVDTNVRVFAYPDSIDHGMTILDKVMTFLMEFPDIQPLAIIAKKINPIVIKKAEQLNMERTYPISIHVVQDDNKFSRSDWELMAVLAMSGTISMLDPSTAASPILMENTFIADKIEVTGTNLELFGILQNEFKNTENGKLHPYYLDTTKFPAYTDLLTSLLYIIKRAKQGHEKNPYLVNKASSIILQMTSLHAPTIMVAGSTHENLSNLAVVQDALGATMSSLEKGFVAGGLMSILHVMWHTLTNMPDYKEDAPEAHKFYSRILQNMESALGDIFDTVYGPLVRKEHIAGCTSSVCTKGSYRNALCQEETGNLHMYLSILLDGVDTDITNYPVLQPAAIYKELFERTGELLVRLLSTEKIIVPGGAFVEDAMASIESK